MITLGSIQGADAATAALIIGISAATGIVSWVSWKRPSLRRLIPGAIVSISGVLLLIVFYRWGFTQGECESRGDLVCLTNENQGVLTLLALLIAATAIWVEVISKYADERRMAQIRKMRADKVVAAAIDECHHNLIHMALCYDGDRRMKKLPWGISIESVCSLGDPGVRLDVNERLLERLDAFRRTHDTLQELRSGVNDARSEQERANAKAHLLSEPDAFRQFVSQNMGFLVRAWLSYSDVPVCRKRLDQPGLQDLPRLAAASKKAGARYQCFRTSGKRAQAEAPSIRTKESPVVCWIDDEPIGVLTFAFEPRFSDAARSHRH